MIRSLYGRLALVFALPRRPTPVIPPTTARDRPGGLHDRRVDCRGDDRLHLDEGWPWWRRLPGVRVRRGRGRGRLRLLLLGEPRRHLPVVFLLLLLELPENNRQT